MDHSFVLRKESIKKFHYIPSKYSFSSNIFHKIDFFPFYLKLFD